MNRDTIILLAGEDSWTVSTMDRSAVNIAVGSLTASELASNIADVMRSAGYRGEGITIALPSAWCLAATIDLRGLPKRDRAAAIFRLEEKLPLPAEEFTADILFDERDNQRALGVCVRSDRLRGIVESLESAGVRIETITPRALLAAQGLVKDARGSALFVLESGDGFADVIGVDQFRAIAWRWCRADEAELRLNLKLVSAELPATVVPIRARLENSVATGRPWIQLRRGALAPRDAIRTHRRALNAVLASAAALLLCIGAAAAIRGVRYQHATNSAEAMMVDAFHARFPGWDVPVNVRAVIESERQKVSQKQDGALSGPAALASMRDVIGALPPATRVSIDTMAFDGLSFEMTGRVASQADVESLSSAMRSTGFEVRAPLSRREAGGAWTFSIGGTRPATAQR